MVDYTTVFVPGRVFWAKIVGDKALHDNYDKNGKEWSYELCPDDVSFLKEHRLLDRLKEPRDDKNPEKGDYLYLKKPELDKDGNKNDPVTIIDAENEPWDGRLLGNGTKVVAKLTIANFGAGKKKAIWTTAIRIEELVPYEGTGGSGGTDFSEYDGGKPKSGGVTKAKATAKAKPAPELDPLDDDTPF